MNGKFEFAVCRKLVAPAAKEISMDAALAAVLSQRAGQHSHIKRTKHDNEGFLSLSR